MIRIHQGVDIVEISKFKEILRETASSFMRYLHGAGKGLL